MTGMIVVARNRISGSWLSRFPDPKLKKRIRSFRGLDGTAWPEDVPDEIRSNLASGVFYGPKNLLDGYVSQLLTRGYRLNVLEAVLLLASDFSTGPETDSAPNGATFDVAYTTDFSEFYSVLLHAMGHTDELARSISARVCDAGLVASADGVRQVVNALGRTTSCPSWLEPSYIREPEAHLYVAQIRGASEPT